MYSRAEQYRRRGIEWKQRATQATEPNIREAFEQVASNWFALAEQAEWLEGRRYPKQAALAASWTADVRVPDCDAGSARDRKQAPFAAEVGH
jgi:hypothetical protein